MQQESLFHLHESFVELIGFLGIFLAAGAFGFRFSALARVNGAGADAPLWNRMAKRAAVVGLVGVVILGAMFLTRLAGMAERAHKTPSELLTTDRATMAQAAGLVVALLGYVLALVGQRFGWILGAVGVTLAILRSAVVGQWSRLVNPLHELSGGLWIGTLFVLVVAGLAVALRDQRATDRRGTIVADLVNGFSPLALGMGGLLVLMGVITGWRHLRGDVTNLWTTPYGLTLIVKLVVVAFVFGLGAWNWRRQRPSLGSDAAAAAIRRSSIAELTAAFIVLLVTSVLVTIPAPRPPVAPGPTPQAGP